MGTIDDACGPVSPRETPRFGVGSASTAIVLNPFRANDHARPGGNESLSHTALSRDCDLHKKPCPVYQWILLWEDLILAG